MKKSISLFLVLVLVMVLSVSPQPIYAEPLSKLSVEATDNIIKPVSYLSEYNQYSNIVGCLNSDGSKTVYLFGEGVDEQAIESITGLEMSSQMSRNLVENVGSEHYIYDDTTVYANMPNTNYCNQDYFEIGNTPTRGVAQTYIRFDLSELSNTITNDNIISAYYRLYGYDVGTRYVDVDAYLVTEDWSEAGITWSNRPDYYAGEKLSTVSFYSNGNIAWYPPDLYLTKAVKAWVQGVANHGICLKLSDYANSNETIYRQFASANSVDSFPYLCITYTDESLVQTPGIVSGQNYYVVNKKSEKYLHANSLISGTNVYQTAGTGAALQHWTFTYLNNGYYSIRVNNTTACLEVLNGGTGNGVDIRVGSYTGEDKQQWKVARNWNGTYRIIPKLAPTKAVLVGTSSTANGDNVYQATYTHNYTYNDDWSLVSVAGGEASAFCFSSAATDDIDTTAGMSQLYQYIDYNGRYETVVYQNKDAAFGLTKLLQSPLFIFSSHGEKSEMNFFSIENNMPVKTAMATHYEVFGCDDEDIVRIDQLSTNALAHLQLFLIQSCLTGGNYGNTNLVGEAHRLGSHNIISNTCRTEVGPDHVWLLTFVEEMAGYKSIGDAKEIADQEIYENYDKRHGGILQRHDLGDDSVHLLTYPTSQVNTSQSNLIYVDNITQIVNKANKQIKKNNNMNPNGLQYITTQTDSVYEKQYDVYRDSSGGVYKFDKTNNQLSRYRPFTNNLDLGNTLVDGNKAFACAQSFLDCSGYDIEGFAIECSNEYSKTYRIAYKYLLNGAETSEKIVLYMQADDNGDVYLTNFMVDDYGMFSRDTTASRVSGVPSAVLLQKAQAVQATYGQNTTIDRVYWTKDENGMIMQKALIVVEEQNRYFTRVVQF